MRKHRIASCGISIGLAVAATSSISRAEEGGAGHYFPGSISSFIDGVPAQEQFVARIDALSYDGSFDTNVSVPIGGLSALDVGVEVESVALTAVWRPPLEISGNWSYAAGLTVPFVDVSVSAELEIDAGNVARSVRRSDSESGVGDIVLYPLMLNYTVSDALNYNFRVNLYAPTGDYEVGRLANPGRNYWSAQPVFGAVYLSPENGRELAVYTGFTFNWKNDDTNYESGTQMFLETTAAQHFPLLGGIAGAGITGYWYEQITGDSGDGARFGDFKARARGVGPTLSYVREMENTQLALEFKWIHESGVERRPEGDTVYLKFVITI